MPRTLHYQFDKLPSLSGHDDYAGVSTTPDLSITRATTAFAKDSDGWLREVQSGEARFPGAEFNHNLFLQSNDLSTSWINVRSTDTQSAGTDPDGGSTANSLNEDGTAANTHYIYQSTSLGNSKVFAFSVYLKASNRTWAYLRHTSSTSPSCSFDLTNGVVGTEVAGGSGVIEDAGNGWYRCTLIGTTDSATGAAYIYAGEADNDITFDGLSQESILTYGAQLEDVSGAWDSENLLLQSNSFDTTWVNTRSTDTSGISDPDGGTSAWSLNEDGTAGLTHYIGQQRSGAAQAGAYYFFSVYAKASNRSWIRLDARDKDNTSCVGHFDLTNGATGTESNIESSGITSVGGGWYRCWIKFKMNGSGTSENFFILIAEADNDVVFDGLSQESVLLYKAQLERTKPSQTGPGTYTATTTAAVTNYSPSTYIATTTAAVSSLSGANDGLLVEEARTNICLQSEDLTTTWSTSFGNSAPVANQTIAPDGSLTADKLIDDAAASGTAPIGVNQTITVATATTYCASVFAKADQLSTFYFEFDDLTTPVSNTRQFFNLSAGTVGTTTAGIDDAGIEDYGNGWYRCWATITTDAADTSGTLWLCVAESDGVVLTPDDGTSSIFLWGAQLEAGAFMSTYIPTTTGSVTRNADEINNITDVSWHSQGASTYFIDGQPTGIASGNQYLWYLGDGASDTQRIIHYITPAAAYVLLNSNSGTDALITGGVAAAGTRFRYAAGCATNDYNVYLDGSSLGTDTAVTASSTIAKFGISNQDDTGNNNFNGLIKEIAYWDSRLENNTLSDLSDGTVLPSNADDDFLFIRRRLLRRPGFTHVQNIYNRRK